jgi:hypothetical protein
MNIHANLCIFAEDLFDPIGFPHQVINSFPTLAIATYFRDRYLPRAHLAGVTSELAGFPLKTLDSLECQQSQQVLFFSPAYDSNGTLIANDQLLPTTWDCYPFGSYDFLASSLAHYQQETVAQFLSVGIENKKLLVYSSRDESFHRRPDLESSKALQTFLRSAAEQLGLEYFYLSHTASNEEKRHAFIRAEIVIGPHGGAFCNVFFAQLSTLIIEFQPSQGKRFCYACVASARGFKRYGIFVVKDWIEINEIDYLIDIEEFKKYFHIATKTMHERYLQRRQLQQQQQQQLLQSQEEVEDS